MPRRRAAATPPPQRPTAVGRVARARAATGDPPTTFAFAGFEPLGANFLYCPNQFFDVCLPHSSRGTVRLVAYLLRRTLGWLDHEGRPIEQRIAVTYTELIREAGISRGAIGDAVDAAIKARLVRRVARGRSKAMGDAGKSSSFELAWAEADVAYTTDLRTFDGFFAGEGHRSPIPNAFFDVVVPAEPLAVVQVVGAVLRHTVGYQNQFGGRRGSAPLSYSYLQRYTGIGGRRHLADALFTALGKGYVQCVREGAFGIDADGDPQAAHYAVRWAANAERNASVGSEREPAILTRAQQRSVQNGHQAIGPKREPIERSKKGTRIGSRTAPANRFKQGTEEKTSSKDTLKQQQHEADAAAARDLLMREGFDASAADRLAAAASVDEIRQQVTWLPRRRPTRNRLGMLRQSILESWPEPQAVDEKTSRGATFARFFLASLGGNAGAPVAEPSGADAEAGERFASRLAEADPAGFDVERSGRRFGAFVREATMAGRPPHSFSAAVRAHGDRFLARSGSRPTRASRAAYHVYAAQRVEQLRTDKAVDWASFEAWRARERERYVRGPGAASPDALAWFDSDAKFYEHVASFFEGHVLPFARWAVTVGRTDDGSTTE